MGFAESFEKAYISSSAQSSQATLEAIKEKIKNDQTKADEKYKATTLRNANIALATQFGDEDIAKKIITVSEGLGDNSEGQKIISEFATGMLKDKVRNQNRPGVKPVPAVTFDPVSGKYMDQSGNPVTEIAPTQEVRQKALPAEVYGERKSATEAASQKFLKEPEIQYTRDLSDTRDTLGEVRAGLEELGIKDPTKYGNVVTETFDSEFGPISLPAKFNLVGQYAKDPKYTALKNKMERSFQKFRKVITGAQASYSELQALRPLIASFQDRPNVFFEQLGSLENETDRMLGNHLDILDAVGRDTTKIRGLIKTKQAMKQDDEAQVSALGFDPSKWEIVK